MRLFRNSLVAVAVAVAVSLSACSGLGLNVPENTSPASVADKTVIDEKTMLGLETLYLSANQLAMTALDLGAIKSDEDKAKLRKADNDAYSALLAARAAYEAANSGSFNAAALQLVTLSEQIRSIIGKR